MLSPKVSQILDKESFANRWNAVYNSLEMHLTLNQRFLSHRMKKNQLYSALSPFQSAAVMELA